MQNMSTITTKDDTRSTIPERTAGLQKPQVLLAGAFAGRLLPTIRQRFAVQAFETSLLILTKSILQMWVSPSSSDMAIE